MDDRVAEVWELVGLNIVFSETLFSDKFEVTF